MYITIRAIGHGTATPVSPGVLVGRYPITFASKIMQGRAEIVLQHNADPIALAILQHTVVNKTFCVSMNVRHVSDFRVSPDQTSSYRCTMLPNDDYLIHGQIARHLITGEGSLFVAGDIQFVIGVEMLPPDTLEVPEGTWVELKVQGICFWLQQAN